MVTPMNMPRIVAMPATSSDTCAPYRIRKNSSRPVIPSDIATILGMFIGVTMGSFAGYFGGGIDMFVSRLTELVMAFPLLLFALAVASTVGPPLHAVTFGVLRQGVFALALVSGCFSGVYPARIIPGE